MATLASYQKLSRVLSKSDFGSGADGDYSSATIPTVVKDACTGSASSTALTTSGSTFANGDILIIHQTQLTNAGQWEINKVVSGGGTTSLTLQKPLQFTYGSKAQAVKIPQYNNVTVQSGTWTVPAWNGTTGGVFAFACKGVLTKTGAISANGKGFRGGTPVGANAQAYQGESKAGGGGLSTAANNMGGGGADSYNDPNGSTAGGGGGGYASAGDAGYERNTAGSQEKGSGGLSGGSADLTILLFGGAGGAGSGGGGESAGNGGESAGILVIFAKEITGAGVISANGVAGGSTQYAGGGGGAGGSVLIITKSAVLGTNSITASLGAGGTSTCNAGGGNASVGRIAIHHLGTVTGTTSPAFTDVSDLTLKNGGGGVLLNLIYG